MMAVWKVDHAASLAYVLLLSCSILAPCTAQTQYKVVSRDQMRLLAAGETESAAQNWQGYLELNPEDLEACFGLAACYGQLGRIDEAMQMARRAVELGLPLERFLAGPRELLEPLTSSQAFATWAEELDCELLHGPTLGCLTDRGASVWVRTWHELPVIVRVSKTRDMQEPQSFEARTSGKMDFTGVIGLDDLEASTAYYYQLVVDGELLSEIHDFRTLPQQGQPARFSVIFGGGAGYTPWFEHMWTVIDSHSPLAYMALGDNVYIDTPKQREVQQYCYYRRQSRPEYRKLVASTAVFSIWDDHDFITNDGSGGPAVDEPSWKRDVWHTFRTNMNNPSYGGGEEKPGCWFSTSMADVDFFMMDGRYYRSSEAGSMLGAVQKKWLLDELVQSKATFKVLCANVPMTPGVKPGSLDTWDGFADEREEIFDWIRSERIEGVFIIAADRHRSDAWKIERPGTYPLYEFQSSKLTNIHTHAIIDGCLFGYNKTCSFGMLRFDTAAEDPSVTYDVFTIENELVESITIRASELAFEEG